MRGKNGPVEGGQDAARVNGHNSPSSNGEGLHFVPDDSPIETHQVLRALEEARRIHQGTRYKSEHSMPEPHETMISFPGSRSTLKTTTCFLAWTEADRELYTKQFTRVRMSPSRSRYS